MTAPRIRLDATEFSVVVTCTACPDWAVFAQDRPEGWQLGARHQARTHADDPTACNARNRVYKLRWEGVLNRKIQIDTPKMV